MRCFRFFALPTYYVTVWKMSRHHGFHQPRSQGLRGETVTKTLVKFILSFQNFGKKIACAVRHNRIAIHLNTVVSHCACDFFPKFWNDKTNFTRVFVTVSPRRPWDRGWVFISRNSSAMPFIDGDQ